MISIYDYIDATDFISDKFEQMKAKNTGFSLRAWALHLGMKSHGPLHAILKKQRKIPKKLVPNLIKSLKLTKEESKFFEVLVDFQRAKTPEEMEFYKLKLEKLSPIPLRELIDIDSYRYITDPIYIALSEMTQLRSFKDTSAWIKQHFRINQNLRDIENVINKLKELKVIVSKGDKIIKPVEHIYTKYEVKSDQIQKYHVKCAELAIDQITKQSLDEREYNTVAFNIKKKDLQNMKEDIREFVNELVETYEAKAHEGDETYQLNVQLFSLTK